MKQELNIYLFGFVKTFLLSLVTFLIPIKGLIVLTGLAVLLDTFFAIYTTIKLHGIKSYKSTKLFNIVVKSFFYFGTIILAFFIDTHIIAENHLFGVELFIAKAVTVFWLYIEVKSIDETSQKLGNKSFYVIIKNLMQKTKSLKKDINEITE
jgi:phage-related holin